MVPSYSDFLHKEVGSSDFAEEYHVPVVPFAVDFSQVGGLFPVLLDPFVSSSVGGVVAFASLLGSYAVLDVFVGGVSFYPGDPNGFR